MDEKLPSTAQTIESYELRNAVVGIYTKMPAGPDREAVEALFKRFSDYIGLSTGSLPHQDTGTKHEQHVAELKWAIRFFETMGNTLGNLGLINNWKQEPKDMGMALYNQVREDRAKYRRAIRLITEIYTVHLGGNGALFSIDALPEDIRVAVKQGLKERKLLHED